MNMRDFIKTGQTLNDFMIQRGFTLFTNKSGTISIWMAKLESAADSVNGMDKFLVFDDDLFCGEMWEINHKAREQFDDDTIADMIVNLAEKDFPDGFVWCVTGVIPTETLFN
jgi:hypothetical protein